MKPSRGMGAVSPNKIPKTSQSAVMKKGGMAKQAATAIAMKEDGKKPKKFASGGTLKDVPEDNKGLSKLPTEVRNKMGFMKAGGLYENIHKKQARIAAGSKEKMRKPGSKGAPSKQDFINSAKTAKK